MAYKATADVAGSNKGVNLTRSPLNGGAAGGSADSLGKSVGGRSARPDPEAGNKPLNGSISRPNVKKKDGLNFRSNMMAGASASAGRAQQRKPMPKSRSTSRERTK